MRKIILVFMLIGLIIVVMGLLFWFDLQQPPPITYTTCKLTIQVYTQQGPHADPKYNLSGSFEIDHTHSKFDRNLETSNYPITLYFEKTLVHFVVTAGSGYIFGDGTSDNNLQTCAGTASGQQTGPVDGDKGVWIGKLKREQKVINPPSIESKLLKWVGIGFVSLPIMFLLGWFMSKLYAKDE